MGTVTEPVMLDRTGQIINERLMEIRNVLSGREKKTIVYGFHIDSSESDPEDAVTYLADAVGMAPAFMNYSNGTFNYGSWEDAFFMPRPCMLKYDGTVDYYLDPNNYAYKEDGLTPSDIADDTYGGNAMMEWGRDGQKIWYKIVPDTDPTSASVYISNYQVDKNYHAWSFINNQGDYVDHFYTPIYNGFYDGTRMRSISGKTPTASLNATTERTYCRANNTTDAIWDTEVFCDNLLIILLLTLMSKSLNSQEAFGQGNTTSGQSGVLATGTGDAKGLFWGSNGTTSVVKVFGMENYWGNLWRRFGGLVNVTGTSKYKLTRGRQDGSSADDYIVSTTASDYSGYLVGGTLPSDGQVQKMMFDGNTFWNNTSGGSSSTYYCDYFWNNAGATCYAFRGGTSNDGAHCGSWFFDLGLAASFANWYIAAAPSCKPLS